ncbi:MAG: glycoside hydrolase TIM-barrel-like domain-containing protein, partial [Rickettsiales bacterium]|nr:glycoside hydrolase TIM-barrel-like domain-containing protein [Rickettsiales bacterium]
EGKPWRGRLTGSVADVASFFTKTNGYNAFITHYATLTKDYVDAFSIGSELIGLTKVNDGSNNFPAVNALVSLAATVKGIVGSGVKVTYAADWSEYHHTDGGWYNLDPLWASADIDMVGIDAYFPLTDAPQTGYDVQTVIDGWTSGEGYDWYYTDPERTTQASLSAPYAWKNIQWWWENSHVNPDTATTAWVPESKPIWFTEVGFPSVDGATNQPNVFYDPNSSEGALPRFSKGRVDFLIQRVGLMATEKQWEGSTMIERRFVWTWDARPYPFWPDLTSVWSDGGLWAYGHWISGKLGLSALAGIVADLTQRAGLESADYDVSLLESLVDGYVLSRQTTIREAIEELQTAYFFDGVETDGVLYYIPRAKDAALSIGEDDLIPMEEGESHSLLEITRVQEQELPQKVDVLYLNRAQHYQTGTQHAQRLVVESQDIRTINLPIVLTDQAAKTIADTTLYRSWLERDRFRCLLPMQYADLNPGDVVEITADGALHEIRILRTRIQEPGAVLLEGVAEDRSVYDFYTPPGVASTVPPTAQDRGVTRLALLDIPALPSDTAETMRLRVAMAGEEAGWRGAVLYRSEDGGSSYAQVLGTDTATVMGTALTALADGPVCVFDASATVRVSLISGTLSSTSQLAVLNGANAAMIGDEIMHFTTATLESAGVYVLSGLLRGRLGTEHATSGHSAGETLVLLNSAVSGVAMSDSQIDRGLSYKPASVGQALDDVTAISHTYTAQALVPYAPVHLSGTRDASANLTINWVRRTRVGGSWRDGVDVPLSEESEQYEVEILNGGSVVRMLTSTTTQVEYTAAQQNTDFGSTQSNISVRIYQISALVGRGNVAAANV